MTTQQTVIAATLEIHILCLATLIFLVLLMRAGRRHSNSPREPLLSLVYLLSAFMIISDCAWTLLSLTCSLPVWACYVINDVYFFSTTLATYFWFLFVAKKQNSVLYREPVLRILVFFPALFLFCMIAASPTGDLIYKIVDGNYVRSSCFFVDPVIKLSYIAGSVVLSLLAGFRQRACRRYFAFSYIFYAVPVLLSGVLQSLFGFCFNCLGLTVGLAVVFTAGISNTAKENNNSVHAMAQSYDAAFFVDLDTSAVRVIRRNAGVFPPAADPQKNDYETVVLGTLEKLIRKPELSRIRAEFDLSSVEKKLSARPVFSVGYPVARSVREPTYQRATFLRAVNATWRREFFLGIESVSGESMEEQQRHEVAAFLAVLAQDYIAIAYVHLPDGNVLLSYGSVPCGGDVLSPKDAPSFLGWLRTVAKTLVHPDDRRRFLRETERDYVAEKLRKMPAFYIPFRGIQDDQFYEIKFVLDKNSSDRTCLVVGLRNLDEQRRDEIHLKKRLEAEVAERTAELTEKNRRLSEINDEILVSAADIIEARDGDSGEHIRRVREMTRILATCLCGKHPECGLTEEKIRAISTASVLHDIGKIMIPDSILQKPGRLTEKETEVMKTHCALGCFLLEKLPHEDDETTKYAMELCRCHHEKYDGNGYPQGLVGDEIPLSAQIVSVVDCYDALRSKRSYKESYSAETSLHMILDGACGAFSPMMLDALCACAGKLEEVRKTFGD